MCGMASTSDPVRCLEFGHVGPQVLGVLAVELGEGQGLVGHAGIAAEQHVAVQVVAADGRPLEADHRGEHAGVVVLVGQRRIGLPGVAHGLLALDRRHVARERADDFHGGGEDRVEVAAGQRRIPLAALLGRQDLRIAAQQLRHQTIHLGMVRDHQEVERPRRAWRAGPPVETTSSPRAKRKASSWPSRFIVPASTETAVCRWVSPNSGRVGKLRPA